MVACGQEMNTGGTKSRYALGSENGPVESRAEAGMDLSIHGFQVVSGCCDDPLREISGCFLVKF